MFKVEIPSLDVAVVGCAVNIEVLMSKISRHRLLKTTRKGRSFRLLPAIDTCQSVIWYVQLEFAHSSLCMPHGTAGSCQLTETCP